MSAHLDIDFVSDVSCPWCVIGLRSLEQAVAGMTEEIDADIRFQPFELNPRMPPEGQDLDEHLLEKYGATPEQFAPTRRAIAERGEELGFEFRLDRRNRIYNTFDAHRLLHWAEHAGRQLELKHALFRVYFTEGENPGSREVLLRVVEDVGLDPQRAAEILDSEIYADEVRERERHYQSLGINAVPAVIVNGKYLIQGGQPASVFEQALREIATKEG